jgi:hypothetical protein
LIKAGTHERKQEGAVYRRDSAVLPASMPDKMKLEAHGVLASGIQRRSAAAHPTTVSSSASVADIASSSACVARLK